MSGSPCSESSEDSLTPTSTDISSSFTDTFLPSETRCSPTQSILLNPSDSSPSLASPSRSSSISFAPLPTIAPRKRYYSLGVAARAGLLRRSQSMPSQPERLTDDREYAFPRSGTHTRRRVSEGAPPPEDPLLMFGRMLSGASRNLWRRVSAKTMREPQSAPDLVGPYDAGSGVDVAIEALEQDLGKMHIRQKELHIDRMVQYTLKEENEEGAMWDEELGIPELRVTSENITSPDREIEVCDSVNIPDACVQPLKPPTLKHSKRSLLPGIK